MGKKIPLHVKIKAFLGCILMTIPLFIAVCREAEEEARREEYERGGEEK